MKSPNVLLVCVDHWPASFLGCAGHDWIQTPTLDQLAANGIRFPNTYSATPICLPARRTLMTGLTTRSHSPGTRENAGGPMPPVPTLAQCFRDAGYQAYAVGKLHVQPQRQRIGFDDVLLEEEGRMYAGGDQDDYDIYLTEHGYVGRRFTHGMCNNTYVSRPWHLPEQYHVTNWAAQQMSRVVQRRDPRCRRRLYKVTWRRDRGRATGCGVYYPIPAQACAADRCVFPLGAFLCMRPRVSRPKTGRGWSGSVAT